MAMEDVDVLIEAVRKEIEEKKQYLERMTADRNEWRMAILQNGRLKMEMNNQEQGSAAREEIRKELEISNKELERVSSRCFERYHISTALKFGSEVDDRKKDIEKMEVRLKKLEEVKDSMSGQGSPPGQGSQSQQDQGVQSFQRVKGVAEPQAEFMKEMEKHYELARPPEHHVPSKDAARRQMDFREERERLKRAFEDKDKDRNQNRNRGNRDK